VEQELPSQVWFVVWGKNDWPLVFFLINHASSQPNDCFGAMMHFLETAASIEVFGGGWQCLVSGGLSFLKFGKKVGGSAAFAFGLARRANATCRVGSASRLWQAKGGAGIST
jgi:hypothetical protein